MPRKVLEQGVPWGWHTFGDYLDTLEGKIGINVGGLVGKYHESIGPRQIPAVMLPST